MTTNGQNGQAHLMTLERNGRGELVARLSDREEAVSDVRLARCFPWSVQDDYISVRDKDGKELVLITDRTGLDAATNEQIDRELREKVFVPRISRITHFRSDFDTIAITAQTDRGEVTFQLAQREDVRILPGRRALFRDVDGNIYEIEDLAELDGPSRNYLERYL